MNQELYYLIHGFFPLTYAISELFYRWPRLMQIFFMSCIVGVYMHGSIIHYVYLDPLCTIVWSVLLIIKIIEYFKTDGQENIV